MGDKKFKHELGDTVTNKTSNESGEVVGRAEYTNCESSYYVRHKAADGRAVKAWWDESDIA